MKVSFLVTYYNQKKYVRESLDSILAIRKKCDWEILVGDDGSTDGTIEEVKKYVEKFPDKIKLYIMPREKEQKYDSVKRASANRLNILKHSTGDIFCVLDGDDYYIDYNFINESIDIFNKNANVSIVAFGYETIEKGITAKKYTLKSSKSEHMFDEIDYLKDYYIPAGACVFRKSFGIKRIDYLKKIGFFDDNNILINNLNYGGIYAVNRVIYAYRQVDGSVFSSMKMLEKAVLNVQGMDVDLRYAPVELKKYVVKRYARDIVYMYIWKKEIERILGVDKFERYKEGCLTMQQSLCYDILNGDIIKKRNSTFKIVRKAISYKIVYAMKQYILREMRKNKRYLEV